MKKEEIKQQILDILNVDMSQSGEAIKENFAEKLSTVIDNAITDKYNEMKQYVDSKIS